MRPQPRSGDHIQQRGNVFHYWRIIPPDCKTAYGKSVESRSLDTMNRTEAKRLAKAIDVEVEARIREIRAASDPEAIAEQIAKRVLVRAAGDPSFLAHRYIQSGIEDAPLTDEARAKAADLAWQKIDEGLTRMFAAKKLGQEIASMLEGFAPEQIDRCRTSILSMIRDQIEAQAALTAASPTCVEQETRSPAPQGTEDSGRR
jgi:hypothetical protein